MVQNLNVSFITNACWIIVWFQMKPFVLLGAMSFLVQVKKKKKILLIIS